jgi:hypothetical protein
MTLRATPLLLAALLVTGCKHTASPAAASTEAPVAAPVNPATAGAITGVVHFTGKPPARVPIDMSMDPACAMSTTPNQTEQYVIDHGNLANVYVYVKAGIPSSSAPASAPPVVLDQKGCRYIPHVIAVQQGGRVQFRNSDPTMGQPQTETFKAAEIMLPVRCNNHPWMEAFINIAPNPYYAVTAADGSFTIPNLPPGTYTLAAIHEKLGEQDMQITVAPKATAQANFSFSIK